MLYAIRTISLVSCVVVVVLVCLVSYLEEDTLALDSLHRPSRVRWPHIEVVGRIGLVVAWGPKTV